MEYKKVAVIGGGASGIAAAIKAAEKGNRVTIYEHTDSLGKKLLITGNGKCNFSNRDAGIFHYHSSTDKGQTAGVFSRFPFDETRLFLEKAGLYIREKEGRFYPYTDSSKTVLKVLKLELKSLGVEVLLNSHVSDLADDLCVGGRSFDRVILATGGCSFKNTGSDGSGLEILKKSGIRIIEPLPALTPLPLKEDVSDLKGVRCSARVTLFIDGKETASAKGELQPYEKGLSGICAMDLSGQAARALFEGKKAEAETDFFPECSEEDLKRRLEEGLKAHPRRGLKDIAGGLFTEKLVNFLFHPIDTRKPDHLDSFVNRIKHCRFTVSDEILKDFRMAQATSGGVSFEEVNGELELIKRPGIRLCGEILDIYGDCGGYNLQWALSSGFMAGDIR